MGVTFFDLWLSTDLENLAQGPWSLCTKIFLDCFCPRKDWTPCKSAFIMHLQANMTIATKENLWFKFKLIFVGTKLNPLEPPKYLHQKRMVEN